jgi:hypothetical protein
MKCEVMEILSTKPNKFIPEYKFQTAVLRTPYGCVEKEFFNNRLSVGCEVETEVITTTTRFVERLRNIGVTVELCGNFPWVYLQKVNGVLVKCKFLAEHGFTAFFLSEKGAKFSDRRVVFSKIREMIKEYQ